MSPQFDTNGDGCISLGELRAALKALLGERLSQREVDEILRDIDLNGDGLVDFEGTYIMLSQCHVPLHLSSRWSHNSGMAGPADTK